MSNQFSLMQERRFRPFFFTQFLGAFNDNLFKTALITLVVFHGTKLSNLDSTTLATLLPGLFILPFLLFSASAGQIADKFEKSKIIRYVKEFERAIMFFASLGFYLNNIWLLCGALLMMGMHSTLFGPVKYAYLPQHLKANELVGGNGMVEMGSFVAILLGQIIGATLAALENHTLFTSIATLATAIVGYWTSHQIPNSPAADATLKLNWNPIKETFYNLKFAWSHTTIWFGLIAISWFWFYGATLLAQFPNLAKNILKGDESLFILLLSVFTIGIGFGALLCEKLSKGKLELGLVVFGALGLTLFGADLYFTSTHFHSTSNTQNYSQFMSQLDNWRLLLDIALIGLFGGLYIVPLYALIQSRAEKSHQSRVIAANNILNALLMVVSAGLSLLLFKQGFSIPQLFLVTALLNIIVTVYLCVYQVEYYKTFLIWIKCH
jgi:predicted MFS family arabinose efflux permease